MINHLVEIGAQGEGTERRREVVDWCLKPVAKGEVS